MRFTRRRSDRPDPATRGLKTSLESLERREVLSVAAHPFAPWIPEPYPQASLQHQATVNPQADLLNNQGKIITGTDRQGNQYTITVHGPGTVIVTDITPNDGALDDDIDTIQLVGTNPHTTTVTATTKASAFTPTNGTIFFNRLISTTGAKSIVLNGFTLTQTVPPADGSPNNTNTGIYIQAGVGLLQFHDILAPINQATNDQPINIIIGDPSTPLKVSPTIRLDSIFNTVFNSNASTVPTTPQTAATVNIEVNGTLKGLDIISSTQHPTVDPTQQIREPSPSPYNPRYANQTLSPIPSAGNEFQFPIVSTTGRTSVRANNIGTIKTHGNLTNVTFSRGAVPFQNGNSSLRSVGRADFGGNADAVAIDATTGTIGGLRFRKGLGNPLGASNATTEAGIPDNKKGFPASGLLGGLVTARRIGHVGVYPADTDLQVSTNPQLVVQNSIGNPTYYPRPGSALTSSAITTSESIGKVRIIGNTTNSEIKTGFDYTSYHAGLEGTRAASRISSLRQNGSLINGVNSATYRATQNLYPGTTHIAGNGSIRARIRGAAYVNGGVTALGNQGAGVYAKHVTS
ncbi:hypothetical protein [Singulisphaera sp. PoT]|uniref:hypothetical protein n=1 Tax=Singulisphaera sp. PoT TaxID=3411797 RepID=UPI003BF53E75